MFFMSTTAKWPLRPAAAMYRPLEVKSRVYGPKSAHFSEKKKEVSEVFFHDINLTVKNVKRNGFFFQNLHSLIPGKNVT